MAETRSSDIEMENEKEGRTAYIHHHMTRPVLRKAREYLRFPIAFAYDDVETWPGVEATCRTC